MIDLKKFEALAAVTGKHCITLETVLNGGKVRIVPESELPRPDAPLNALFRYAVVYPPA